MIECIGRLVIDVVVVNTVNLILLPIDFIL